MSGSSDTAGSGNGLALLFSLPFLLIGVIMGTMVFATVRDTWKARAWVEVPATLDRVELKTQRGSKGSTTFLVVAAYHYSWQGRTLRGQRVSLHDGFDNVGSFHEDQFRRLDAAREAGTPVTAYVDPADPTSAVLSRQLRAELVVFKTFFMLAFGGFGAGILATVFVGARKAKALAASRTRHPGRPWLWRPDWERGEVHDDTTTSVAPLAAFAAVWCGVSFPVLYLVLAPAGPLTGGALLFMLFPITGVLLAGVAIFRVIRRLKFGGTVLKLARMPVVPGARMEGELRVPMALDAADGVHLVVRCVGREVRGTGKQRQVVQATLWETAMVSPPSSWRRRGDATVVAVAVDIPANAESSSAPSDDGSGVVWQLEARAEVPGVNLGSVFTLPVFRGPSP